MGVTGFGGLFFRSRDPEALTAWYRDRLSVGAGCGSTGTGTIDQWSWKAGGGPTVFAPFPADSDYFAADKAFMINLRVDDLDALLASLRSAGVSAETRPEWDNPETGRFARIHDPEDNAIELWQSPT